MFGFGKKPVDKAVDAFIAALKSEGIKFNKSDDKPSVFINYSGDNFDSLTFSFFFDDDGESVAIKVFSIKQFEKSELDEAYEFCNKMNNEWRWIRFYVDSDDEFTADMDAVVRPNDKACGQECVGLLHRAVRIVDKVCGEF
ncbi:MAG: YbjN domain-containing protein [Clostridia bacterium]|nr:YbjN domain-containing protein [Clostridia bacterium]